ncbi:MAG: ATP-binding protein [Euryarchaeota archaeon]|nr:ATP-binding protein [Euryarchaeota archaeon]
MELNDIFFVFLGIVNLVLIVVFIYYAFRNALRLKGAVPQYLMVTGAYFFVITDIISVIGVLIFDTIFIVGYIVFIIGLIFILTGEIYSVMIIRKIVGKKSWLTIVRMFSYKSYRFNGMLVIFMFTIPLWTLDIIVDPVSIYDIVASFFISLGFTLFITSERKLYVMTNVFSETTTSKEREEIGLLRDDIAAVRVYVDIINTFVSFGKPASRAMIVNDTLNKWSEEHPVLFENSAVRNNKIDAGVVINNLDRLYEKNRLSPVLKEFSLLILLLVDLYAGFTSSEYANERLTESYRVVKRQYGDTSIIFNILKTMPVGVLEGEKLVALNRDELEEKVKERTIELVNTNKELQIEIKERKSVEEKLRRSQTKIEQQNIQLKKADRIKTDFLNVTSHELRTPMSSIKGYTQMISKQILGQINDEQKKALDVILRNTNRLDALIQDILDVSRLESGTMKFVVVQTDVKNMILETVETIKPFANIKNMEITTKFKDNLPKLNIDKERIKQVLTNILNNAIKFSTDGSAINIFATNKKEGILFEIQDFGRGIPRNELKKVFNIFYQVDSGEDRKYGGVGLGLPISRGIVLAHGGKIWVKSKMNEGSTFSFTLPIKPVQDIEIKFKELNMFGLEKTETV